MSDLAANLIKSLVRSQLDEAVRVRPLIPGRPEAGPYPTSTDEVADEVLQWIERMEPFAYGLGAAIAERLAARDA